jgi:hypothetical protein
MISADYGTITLLFQDLVSEVHTQFNDLVLIDRQGWRP